MASAIITTDPTTNIEYSLIDGRITSFDFRGNILYDEFDNISIDGWKSEVVKLVNDYGMNIDRGTGLLAFVYNLIDEHLVGYLKDY